MERRGWIQLLSCNFPGGTATGFGADLLILDDTIKNAYEAHHEGRKQEIWDWFTDTMLSRLETGGKIIIIMTRWATDDMAGRALEDLPKAGYKVRHINFKAVQDDGSMLCEEVLSRADFDKKKATMGEDIVEANYNQNPIDLKDDYTRSSRHTRNCLRILNIHEATPIRPMREATT